MNRITCTDTNYNVHEPVNKLCVQTINIVYMFFFTFILLTSVEVVCARESLNVPSHKLDLTEKRIPPGFTSDTHKTKLPLTSEEKAWLAEHNTVRVALFPIAPYQFKNNGVVTGYQVDVLKAMLEKAGLEPEFSLGPLVEVLEAFKEHDADIALNYMKTEQRSRHLLFSKNTFEIQMATFAQAKKHDLDSIEALKNQRIASYKGYGFEPTLKRHFPESNIIQADDIMGMLRLVATGKADAAIQEINTGEFILHKNYLHNVINHGEFLASGESRMKVSKYVVRNDLPQLLSILDKAYAAIAPSEKQRIWKKWFSSDMLTISKHTIHFTPQEQAWLAHNYTVKVRVADHKPYLALIDGKPEGIAVDFINEISERTGVKFHFVINSPSFSVDLKRLIDHTGPDVISSLMPTLERQKYILFTKAYKSSPRFIFTRDDAPFISSIGDLSGKEVSVVKDYVVHNYLAENYPNINLQLYNYNKDALIAVSSGKAFAFIGDIISVPHMINEYGLKNLKTAAPSGLPEHITTMGIRNDWPELRSIMNKGLAAIPAADRDAIINKWSSVRFEHGISPKDVLIGFMVVVIVVSGIILLFVFWNKSLKKQVQERTGELTVEIHERIQAEEATRISEERFKQVANNAHEWVWEVDVEGLYTYSSPIVEKILGYTPEEIVGKKHFYDLFCPEQCEVQKESAFSILRHKQTFVLFENVNVHKSGKLVCLLTSGMPILDKQGELCGYRGTDTDITELKQAEEALTKSELKYRELVDNSLVGVFITDMTGQFIFVNDAMVQMYDFDSIEQMEATTTLTIWADIKDREQMLEALKKHGRVDGFEAKTFTHTGRCIYVLFSAKLKNNFISGMVMDITERKQNEDKIKKNQERLKALALKLTIVEEKQRSIFATELHDNIGQSLVFSRMQLANLRKHISQEKVQELVDELSQLILQMIQDTKELVFGLSSPLLYEIGLPAAIAQWLSEQIAQKHGLETEIIDHSQKKIQNKEMRLILFRNVRELLTNVVKHAHAKKVTVFLEDSEDNVKIIIQDDGRGFVVDDQEKIVSSKACFGIFSVQQRMYDVGGTLHIESEPGKGTRVILTAPFTL
ncbi:MAG: transporter substrate-binding domain-containing protein [Gammaproteobacteria bacterium]|nr:transporter substrate-binding domain-containing protein [Gammaproteobacteria bacterium]